MGVKLAEKEEIYKKNSSPVLYLVKDKFRDEGEDRVFYTNKSIFPLSLVVILFLCLGILFNIGLRIQNINYEKKLYEIREMILLEEERRDRLLLEVSELRSPSRIISEVENNPYMKMSNELEIVEVPKEGNNIYNEKVYDSVSEYPISLEGGYDGILGVIYYVQDIVMVMSESVFTFFIP